MREIPLSQGGKNKGKFVAIVDDDDFERVSKFRWYVVNDPCGLKYARRNENKKHIYIHQFIFGTDGRVDHIDGDGLNNTKGNLRTASAQENMFNRRLSKNNTTGFKGVSLESGKFIARIKINRKKIYLGSFQTPIEAAIAYDSKASELFRDFARLNLESSR